MFSPRTRRFGYKESWNFPWPKSSAVFLLINCSFFFFFFFVVATPASNVLLCRKLGLTSQLHQNPCAVVVVLWSFLRLSPPSVLSYLCSQLHASPFPKEALL